MQERWTLRGYAIEELLGTGATAQVWRARVLATGEHVALKRLVVGDPEQRARARAEAALLSALEHPNLVRLHALVPDRDDLVLVLDLAARGSLRDLLHSRRRLTPGETIAALAPVAAAVAYLHSRSVIHGDVSAANVLFDASGSPLLADVGVARITGDTRYAESTPLYVDPAVAAGAVPDPASDVFMLGAVAFHALTGGPLWTGDTPLATLARAVSGVPAGLAERLQTAGVPAPVAHVVLRALAADPRCRCTAVEFALDLGHSASPLAIDFDAGTGLLVGAAPAAEAVTITSEVGCYPSGLDDGPAVAGAEGAVRRAHGDSDATPQPGRPEFERPAPVPLIGAAPPLAAVGRPRPAIPRPRPRRFGPAGRRRQVPRASHAGGPRPLLTRVWWPVLAGAAVVVAALVACMAWLVAPSAPGPRRAGAAPRSTAPLGTTQRPSGQGSAAPTSAADWLAVLARLDGVRAQAYASRRPELLSHVYLQGELLRRDTAQLEALVPIGCGLTGAVTTYRTTAVLQKASQIVVLAEADMPATTLVCHGAIRASAPARDGTGLRIVLIDTADGPRIADQTII